MNPSLASTRLLRCTRHVSIVPVTAAFLFLMGLGSNAQASPCLAEAAGNPALNCTANDFGVASVTVNTILDDGCQFEGDTFTFNGSLKLTASNASRYDVGFYIGGDGTQSYTGSCTVGLIPPGTSTANDGDACGDFDGTPISVPIQNVTSVCTDTNNDGFFDLAMCTSWDQNGNAICNGIADAIPGTSSKCSCSQVETTQPVPEPVDPTCLTNADCTSDSNVCTDEVCNPGGAGADLFGCTHPNNTASCDNGLFCDGADVCSAGTCGHAGDPCVGGGVCGDTCNETANNCFDPSGTVCRAAAGVCDTAETCTGSNSACPVDTFLTTTCRASSGVCDTAEICTGASANCPADGLVAAGTVCRSDAGDCDVAETCTGTSPVCPANGFNQAGTTCTSDANACTDDVCNAAGGCTHANNTAACDNGLFCDGTDVCSAGTCGHAGNPCVGGGVCGDTCNETADNCFDPSGTVCRAAAGACDAAETCTGSNSACPVDAFLTTTCRASSGVCDTAEICTGASANCPADGLAAAGTVCRSDAGDCDVAETCTGTSATCPAEAFNPAGTACTSDANVCTNDVCNAAGGCTHANNTAACDNGLFCDGADVCSAGTCGHAGNPCVGGGVCGDTCNETADNCFDPSGTVCRAAAGACDAAETCTGSNSACPVDAFLTTTCRASSGVCDTAEICTGASANCPVDGFAAAGTTCRSDAGDCDVAETCTGTSATCPVEAFNPAGTACTSDANVCTNDVCNAAGGCTHASNTAACDDGLFCTVGDVCTGGACAGAARDCGDAVACTAGSCDEVTNVCVQLANDSLCNDADDCTQDSCSIAQGSCVTENICGTDICRSAGFWSTHSGYEKTNSVNVGQMVLDAVGPLEVCGETISATSNEGAPYVDGLGLTSDLEGLCMRTQGVKQRQLYRQLLAAALNCAVSGGDCDAILARYIDVSFTECSNLCEGLAPAPGAPTVGECVSQLDCFNNGGQIVDGKCAHGTCADAPSLYCGSDFGSCPDVNALPQECEDFENSCHEADLCNNDIGVCPTKTPASSPNACKEARFNDCTIDSCN